MEKDRNFLVIWIEVWSSKGIQKILNKVWSKNSDLDFETINIALRHILRYPWLWDEWNISRFIDVFYRICQKFSSNSENRMTLIWTWKLFNELRDAQEMTWITISTEDQVLKLLEARGKYTSASNRIEWTPIWGFK